jgi:hypothetical protein
MNVLLIIVIGFTLTVSAVIIIGLIRSMLRSYASRSRRIPVVNNPDSNDIEKFNCRCTLVENEDAGDQETHQSDDTFVNIYDSFKLEICGTIHGPEDHLETTAMIFVSDVTDGQYKAMSVRSSVDEWEMKNSGIFCYKAQLGSLPKAQTVLSDWMEIAEFSCDTLMLPKKGTRVLQFRTSIFSNKTNEEIAHAAFEVIYENPDQGYLDVEGDIYHANNLGVSLGFAFAGAGGRKIPQKVTNLIGKWAGHNLDRNHQPGKIAIKAQHIYTRITGRFRLIEKIRNAELCGHINDIAPLAIKCNILLLCLHVIATCEQISTGQINMLKRTARLLDINTDRLRSMIEDLRPFALHEVKDMEISLGITADMNKDQVKQQLSTEYRKWNSRVINSNAEIRDEAENMLELIGEAKEELCSVGN